jgi:hypothetical protein
VNKTTLPITNAMDPARIVKLLVAEGKIPRTVEAKADGMKPVRRVKMQVVGKNIQRGAKGMVLVVRLSVP